MTHDLSISEILAKSLIEIDIKSTTQDKQIIEQYAKDNPNLCNENVKRRRWREIPTGISSRWSCKMTVKMD